MWTEPLRDFSFPSTYGCTNAWCDILDHVSPFNTFAFSLSQNNENKMSKGKMSKVKSSEIKYLKGKGFKNKIFKGKRSKIKCLK